MWEVLWRRAQSAKHDTTFYQYDYDTVSAAGPPNQYRYRGQPCAHSLRIPGTIARDGHTSNE